MPCGLIITAQKINWAFTFLSWKVKIAPEFYLKTRQKVSVSLSFVVLKSKEISFLHCKLRSCNSLRIIAHFLDLFIRFSFFQTLIKFQHTDLEGVFAKNEKGYRHMAKNKCFWSLLFLLLSVASIRRKLLNDVKIRLKFSIFCETLQK